MISKRLALNQIITALKRKGFQHNGGANFCGKLRVSKLDIDIEIDVKDPLFGVYPVVRVCDISQLEGKLLSHIEGQENNICYKPATGIEFDLAQPAASILRVLEDCKYTLEHIIKGESIDEISREYQSYWKPGFEYHLFHIDFVSNAFVPSKVFIAERHDGSKFFSIGNELKLAGHQIKWVSDIMLFKTDIKLSPIGKIVQPKTLADLEQWVVAQETLDHTIFEKIVYYLSEDKAVMFIANNAILGFELEDKSIYKGIKFTPARRPKLMRIKKNDVKITGIKATKCDLASVVGRNNVGFTTLEGKNIALIGCGTIGGHLSKMLVQSGAGLNGKFTIVDDEVLTVGNVGRHLLGVEYVGIPKAKALESEIVRFHPDIKIAALANDALEIWQTIKTNDLVIDATGDWNFQNALNQLFMSDEESKISAIIHSWILLNGIAVQSFLNAKDYYACFRCLRPDILQPPRFKASKNYDKITKVPASCGDGDYIPFSVDVSHVAASLANRAAIDWASGEFGPRLRTMTTDFKSDNIENLKPKNPSKSPHCPICGGEK